MKLPASHGLMVILTSLLFFGTCFIPLSSGQVIYSVNTGSVTMNGDILFSPMDSTETYLIDYTGTVLHEWPSSYLPGEAVCWVGNGTILRTIKTKLSGFGGTGGGVQMVLWDGTAIWDFRYDTNGNLSHHDIKILPNGDILMIAWETKTDSDAIAAGRDPATLAGGPILPTHIIEVKPTGPTTGDIVWEWHIWDHLIQDFDATKANYGVVADHPELLDINAGGSPMKGDWLHANSIDYNPQFDQIMISIRNLDEIWIIDHSTTTAEAAGHTGGNSGKGGDILYRWGNPKIYQAGTADDEKLFSQHDATWIKPGCPGAGDILVFNNGLNRPDSMYSTVDEIKPPVDETGSYSHEPGAAYQPEAPIWSYIGDPPESFFSNGVSGAERLADGNTLICNGIQGKFFEVTPDGTTVWEYINPYPSLSLNNVFKIVYIPTQTPSEPGAPDLKCTGVLTWADIKPGATVNGTFQVQNIGDNDSRLNWTVDTSSITWGNWTYSPDHGENLKSQDGPVTVQVTVTAPMDKKTEFSGYIKVENTDNPDDFDVISVSLTTPLIQHPVHPLWNLFQQFFNIMAKRFAFMLKGFQYR